MKTKYIVENNLKNDIAIYDFPEKKMYLLLLSSLTKTLHLIKNFELHKT